MPRTAAGAQIAGATSARGAKGVRSTAAVTPPAAGRERRRRAHAPTAEPDSCSECDGVRESTALPSQAWTRPPPSHHRRRGRRARCHCRRRGRRAPLSSSLPPSRAPSAPCAGVRSPFAPLPACARAALASAAATTADAPSAILCERASAAGCCPRARAARAHARAWRSASAARRRPLRAWRSWTRRTAWRPYPSPAEVASASVCRA